MDILGLVDVPHWLIAILGILVAIYVYYARKYSFWSSRGVKQIKYPLPFLGNMLPIFLKPLHEVERERYKKYGGIYGAYEGRRPVLVVGEPDLVRKILVKDFSVFPSRRELPFRDPMIESMLSSVNGERWKYLRTVVSQTFSSGKMRKMAPLISECANALVENFQEAANKNKPVDCKRLIGAFTMDVIASCAFATKIDTHKDPDNLFLKHARKLLDPSSSFRFFLLLLVPKLLESLGVTSAITEETVFFSDITRKIIESRKEKKEERNDFLQLLINASEMTETEDTKELESPMESAYDMKEKGDGIQESVEVVKKKELSEVEVVAQCFLFFLAGFDTIATTLSFALYHLALEPEIQEKLRNEIVQAVEKHGEATYETLSKMPYLDAFVSEILRLNSPGIRLERVAEQDYELGDTGIIIPKGTLVEIPAYAMHHDPKFFPNPEKFDPERFMPGNKENIIPYTYLPFGSGPRNCVALRFALMEAKLCLAKLLLHCSFLRCRETKVPLEYHPATQVLQPNGIILKVVTRSTNK